MNNEDLFPIPDSQPDTLAQLRREHDEAQAEYSRCLFVTEVNADQGMDVPIPRAVNERLRATHSALFMEEQRRAGRK